MLTSTYIQKYTTRGIPWLRKKAGEAFRAYIRQRDHGKPCISCGNYRELEAGHYYSAGKYPELEFNEDNTHGQCKQCNRHLHSNAIEYRKRLLVKIGEQRLDELDRIVAMTKRTGFKHDRFYLIEIIETYRQKLKS